MLKRERQWVALMCVLSVVMSLSYALFVPPGERRDEGFHYQLIDYVAFTGKFPSRTTRLIEGHQAPLYYLPAILLKRLVVGSETHFDRLQLNSHFYYYDRQVEVDPADNVNLYLHPKSQWLPTTDPLVIGVIAVRLFSALLGTLNLLASSALVNQVWPNSPQRRLLAMALITGWQSLQYTFGSVNNDNAVIVFSTICLWLIVRQDQNGAAWLSSIVLGLAMGGAMLSKASGLVVIIPFGMQVALCGWRKIWRYSLVSTLVAFAAAGWWYVRNIIETNDLTGVNGFFAIYPTLRVSPGPLLQVLDPIRLSRTYSNLWLYFDNEFILMPRLFYWVFDALFLIGVAGIIRRLAQRKPQVKLISIPVAVIIGLFVLAMGAAALYFALTATIGNSGRYLLQGGTAIAICIAYGVDQWLSPRTRQWAWTVPATVLMSISAISLYGYYIPAFQLQPVPERIEQPVDYRYGDVVKLIGVKESTVHAVPGQRITVTFYWRALAKGTDDLVVELSSNPSAFADRRSYPGAGKLLAGDWASGDTWTDTYSIAIPKDAQSGTYRILVRILHDDTDVLVLSHTPDGNIVTPYVITLIIEDQ